MVSTLVITKEDWFTCLFEDLLWTCDVANMTTSTSFCRVSILSIVCEYGMTRKSNKMLLVT